MSDVRDPEFRWLEQGQGEAVVLLHGLLGQMHHWDTTLTRLAGGCRAIAPTLPIFRPDIAETSVAELARFVVHLLDTLGVASAVVGGNSLGGHVALATALAFPRRVSALVLTGSSGLFERSYTRGVPHRPSTEYVREKMEEIVFDPALITDPWVEGVRQSLCDRRTALRVLKFARAARRENLEERLTEITVPTLLVWGEADRITPPTVAERFHSLIPDSKLVLLPACGHAPMLERPSAFAAVVRAWLEDTRLTRERPAPAAVAGR